MHVKIGLFFLSIALSAVGADATGKWTGEVKSPSGEVLSPALLVLQQQGSKLEGSGGPTPKDQYPIQKGEVSESGTLRFEMTAGGALMKFDLQIDGDQIKGQMTREKDGQKLPATLTAKREKPI